MRRRVAALFLLLCSLAAAPASAGEKLTMQVSATILPRNTCALGADAAMRCSGTDARVLYRASSGALPGRLGKAPRGRSHKVRTAPGADVVTIEF
jgi:hypothetical protein